MHRDLKPENILLDKDDFDANPKITDFGLSRKEDMKMTVGIGTPIYSAPEIVLKSIYDYSVDIWALGMVLFEMINGTVLYDEANNLIELIDL